MKSIFSPLPVALFVVAVGTVAAQPSSAASPNIEYFQEYETLYLDVCTQRHSPKTCQRMMEALETKLGFFEFALLVSEGRPLEIAALGE